MNRMFFAQNINQIIPIGLGYGRLYNWYAASDVLLPPAGWHLPSFSEMATLTTYLSTNIGGKLKEDGLIHWKDPNTDATNESGFTFLGNGGRVNSGAFGIIQEIGYIWTTNNTAMFRLTYTSGSSGYGPAQPYYGGGVRFIKDDAVNPLTVVDFNGNIYDAITIGTQVWTKQNWKCTNYNNGVPIPDISDTLTWSGLTTGARCNFNNDEVYV